MGPCHCLGNALLKIVNYYNLLLIYNVFFGYGFLIYEYYTISVLSNVCHHYQ